MQQPDSTDNIQLQEELKMTIPAKKIYPRTMDKQTVYLDCSGKQTLQ